MKKLSDLVWTGVLAWSTPAIALAAGPPETFGELVGMLLGYINVIVPIVIAGAAVVYMKNTASGLFAMRSGKADPDWQKSMLWGVLIIFLMVSLWGISSILANTFGIPLGRQ